MQPVFTKFIMCTIYGLICKHAKKKFLGKKVLNVSTVKLFSNKKKQRFMGFFYAFLFQPLIKGKYLPILWFVTFYCLDMAPTIHKNSKFSKEQEFLQIGP